MSDALHVLLIEDNPADARFIFEMTRNSKTAQFTIEHSETLETGLERLARTGIDLVLLDLSLPDSTGLNGFERVHELVPNLAVIVLTGYDDETIGAKAISLGAQDYLVKGQVDAPLLERAIRYAVERKRQERALKQNVVFDVDTGIYTTQYIMNRLKIEFGFAARHRHSFCIGLIDIDNFKQSSEVEERKARMFAETQFAQTVMKELREENVAGRYNNDLFMVLFPLTNENDTRQALMRIQKHLHETTFEFKEHLKFSLDTFVGLAAQRTEHKTAVDLLGEAYMNLMQSGQLTDD